jgi:hypothetical protein
MPVTFSKYHLELRRPDNGRDKMEEMIYVQKWQIQSAPTWTFVSVLSTSYRSIHPSHGGGWDSRRRDDGIIIMRSTPNVASPTTKRTYAQAATTGSRMRAVQCRVPSVHAVQIYTASRELFAHPSSELLKCISELLSFFHQFGLLVALASA